MVLLDPVTENKDASVRISDWDNLFTEPKGSLRLQFVQYNTLQVFLPQVHITSFNENRTVKFLEHTLFVPVTERVWSSEICF